MPTTLSPQIADVAEALRGADPQRFHSTMRELHVAAQQQSPADLTSAIEELAQVLPGLVGWGSKLAVATGAMVEWGGSPLPLLPVLPRRATLALQAFGLFPAVWQRLTGEAPPPQEWSHYSAVGEVISASADTLEITQQEADILAGSWFDLGDWLRPMCTVMMCREFRDLLVDRDDLLRAANAIAKENESAYWVEGLCRVLDDEPLLVLDPASGRGFAMTIAGIGDNYQLHTMLAAALVNDQPEPLPYEPVEPAWLAAATDGPPFLAMEVATHRRFRLFDGLGGYQSPDARPADIPLLDGTRVVVLHPPLGNYRWNPGRIYVRMEPTMTVDRELSREEAAGWLSRVTPAREDDLFAVNAREAG